LKSLNLLRSLDASFFSPVEEKKELAGVEEMLKKIGG